MIQLDCISIQDQTNPYNGLNLSKSDLVVIQKHIKWDQGIWTPDEKRVMKNKIKQCFLLKEVHWHMARSHSRKDKAITLPKMLLSTVLASSLTFASAQEHGALTYINAGISIIVAILTTTSTFLNYNVRNTKHKASAMGYGRLASTIDTLIRLPPDKRTTFGEALHVINQEYSILQRDSPFIQSDTMRKYKKIMDNNSDAVEAMDIIISGDDLPSPPPPPPSPMQPRNYRSISQSPSDCENECLYQTKRPNPILIPDENL